MRYLIDTNIFLALATDRDDYQNLFYISAESVKELIALYRNEKIKFPAWKNPVDMVKAIEEEYDIKIIPIKKEHLLTCATLAINIKQHHKDPSDHIIISQAITEKICLISADKKFIAYKKQQLDFIFNK